MIKVIGVIFVLGSAGWFGLGRALHYYRAVQQLRELRSGIEILKCELNYTLQPIGQLFRTAASRLTSPVAAFFRRYGEELERGTDRERAAAQCLEDTRGLDLPPEAKMCLLELCGGLGRYDLEGENRLLQLCAHRVSAALERAEAEKKPMAKTCAVLAFCAGLALVILTV